MTTPQPGPNRITGLPAGVEVGPLGKRFVAHLIDSLVPALVYVVFVTVLPGTTGGSRVALSVLCALLLLGWWLLVWWMFALRAAGPGMRVMKLQLVGFRNGRPIGFGRFLLRALMLAVLEATVVGVLLMLVFLARHPRHQGWHDLLPGVDSVVIKERPLAPPAGDRRVADEVRPLPREDRGPEARAPEARAAEDRAPEARAEVLAGAGVPGTAAVPGTAVPAGTIGAPAGGSSAVRPATDPDGRSAPAPEPTPAPAAEETAVASAVPANARWAVAFDDGQVVPVSGLTLIGRNPQPRPGDAEARLVKLPDETRTVSKSHLALGIDARGLYAEDRGSTNGSVVTTLAGESTRCTPGEPVHLEDGAIVSLGDHWLEVRRRPG